MASTEVRQKLHDFLLNKSSKDVSPSGHPLNQRSKFWYMYVMFLLAETHSSVASFVFSQALCNITEVDQN